MIALCFAVRKTRFADDSKLPAMRPETKGNISIVSDAKLLGNDDIRFAFG